MARHAFQLHLSSSKWVNSRETYLSVHAGVLIRISVLVVVVVVDR